MHRMSGIGAGFEFGCGLMPLLGDFGRHAVGRIPYENITNLRFGIHPFRLREVAAEHIIDRRASQDTCHQISQRPGIQALSFAAFFSWPTRTVRGRSLALGRATGFRAR